jgi:elongator complex protein 3
MRDIPGKYILAGCSDLALRQTIKRRMNELSLHCQCTRCREYGHRLRDGWTIGKPQLTRFDYDASHGKEVFLCYEDENETLFGLLRLRISPWWHNGNKALVRELHIFGPEVPLGEKKEQAAQHQGLGQKLLQEAERIADEEFHATKISILSGVGVRDYYHSLGYCLQGDYMVKQLI